MYVYICICIGLADGNSFWTFVEVLITPCKLGAAWTNTSKVKGDISSTTRSHNYNIG